MPKAIRSRVVRIGNSRGIRIPKVWVQQLGLEEEVELAVHRGRLIVRPAYGPRKGWEEAFRSMAVHRDDRLLDEPVSTRWDKDEWEW